MVGLHEVSNPALHKRLTATLPHWHSDAVQENYSVSELADAVNSWCEQHRVSPANGQSGESVSERNIRFYRTSGLLDAPTDSGGRGFGEKHFLQLIAVRLLQAQGQPLRRIRELLHGRSLAHLREIQRRAIEERGGAVPPPLAVDGADEIWRVVPLDADFSLVSRRGVPVTAAQRARLLAILRPN